MRRILVIDDMKSFDAPEDTVLVYARTLDEGIEKLPTSRWDELWLDYLLDGWHTGMEIVEYMLDCWIIGTPLEIGLVKLVSSKHALNEQMYNELTSCYKVARMGS